MVNDLLFRLRAIFRHKTVESELDEELHFHFQQQVEKNLNGGMPREEAVRQARLKFGGLEQIKEECRDARGTALLATMAQDLRYGLRMMAKTRGFTLVATITLAVGIGATTMMFAVVDALLIRGLSYKDSERLVYLMEAYERRPGMSLSYPNFQDWEAQNRVFSSMAAIQPQSLTLTGRGLPQQLEGRNVTHDWFRTLGVSTVLGREFVAEDDSASAEPVAILGYGLWQRQFGGDHNILGSTITLDQRTFRIIGVAPPNAYYWTRQPDIYVPFGLQTNKPWTRQRGAHAGIYAVARLKEGVTLEQAHRDMDTIAERLQQQYPETNRKAWVSVQPLRDFIVGSARTALLVLLSAVALLLLIACGNVANLLLARAPSRTKELAIRMALGASRGRVIRQMLTESVLLACAGGALGVLLAHWGTRFLVSAAATALPRVGEIAVDGRVLAFSVALAIGTGIVSGVAPGLHASATNTNTNLKEGSRGSDAAGRQRLRNLLIVGELALSFSLLVGAGLLVRSFLRVLDISPGFNPHPVLAATMVMPYTKYSTAEKAEQFFTETMRSIRAIPGVTSASAIVPLPLSGNTWDTNFILEGQSISPEFHGIHTDIGYFGPDYLNAMQIPLLSGRAFAEADNAQSPPVAIVNAEFVRRTWPNQNPLGKQIRLLSSEDFAAGEKRSAWRTVVGVVGNVTQYGLDEKTVPTVYMPLAQPNNRPILRRDLVIRTAGEPLAIAEQVRRAVAKTDPDQAISDVETMDQYLSESLASRQLYVLLLAAFAVVALGMATMGTYGVIAYWVAERRREIGIRVAVGAQPRQVVQLVLRRSLRLITSGAVLGCAASLALAQGLRSLLFGIQAVDAAVYCTVAVLLSVVALLASYLPARVATRIAPMEAVRYE